jgi:uncharacterized protein YciI
MLDGRNYLVKYVLFYELADDADALAQQHFPAHAARLADFQQRGLLLMFGTFTDPPVGAMAVVHRPRNC